MDERARKLIEPSIPIDFVNDALQSCVLNKLNANEILYEAGLNPASLQLSQKQVSVVDYTRLIELIISKTNDGFLGFLDSPIPKRAFSVFAAQLAGCRTIEELIRQANRFFSLFTQQFNLNIEVQDDTAAIVLDFKETQSIDYRFIHQSILLAVIRLLNWFIGDQVQPSLVAFSFEKSHLDKYLRYLFGSPLRYEQANNRIEIDRKLLSVTSSTNLTQVELMLRDSSRMMLISDRPAPFTRKVRTELLLRHDQQWPDVESISATMNMSKNLLWRKLKKEGTSFLEVRNELKRNLAITLIQDSEQRFNHISHALGFSDVSAFNKAFRKWTGQTPSDYRKSMLRTSI